MTQPMASARVVGRFDSAHKLLQMLAIGFSLLLAVGILRIGSAPYIAFAFCGSFLVFASSGRSASEMLKSAALGSVFAIAYHMNHGATLSYFGQEVATRGPFLE